MLSEGDSMRQQPKNGIPLVNMEPDGSRDWRRDPFANEWLQPPIVQAGTIKHELRLGKDHGECDTQHSDIGEKEEGQAQSQERSEKSFQITDRRSTNERGTVQTSFCRSTRKTNGKVKGRREEKRSDNGRHKGQRANVILRYIVVFLEKNFDLNLRNNGQSKKKKLL